MPRNFHESDACLILSLRHLGDAVIVAGFINALSERYRGITVDVLGLADLRGVTGAFCSIREYIPIELPVFRHHRKSLAAIRDAFRKIALLRNRRYDCCINLMGDMRENTIGSIVGARESISPTWSKTSPFRKHIRTAQLFGLAGQGSIPIEMAGYYASIDSFAEQLGLPGLRWSQVIHPTRARTDAPVVGLHPGASHLSKQWPVENWRELIRRLNGLGLTVKIYGSPSEADRLHHDFAAEINTFAIEVVTAGIPGFIESLVTLDLLVCMDSFSSHAAHAVGLPAVVLHGPFDPSVMTPPSGTPLSAGAMCGKFPCYKGQACANKRSEYICVRGIQVDAVLRAVDSAITHSTHVARL
jgi:ADP-heptose:LPS heptosyltransferase